ncbi:putative transcription factor B3-Domain family [Helianthus anomalus]
MLNTYPSDLVLVRSDGNPKWVVRMEFLDHEVYITTGWSRIKEEMSITDDHLLVFEMVDFKTFDLSVFSCKPALLTYPPEVCLLKKEPTNVLIEVSDDEVPNAVAAPVFEHSVDDEVPITFVVDNHYISLYYFLPHTINVCFLNRVDLISCRKTSFNDMREFVRDKWLVFGSSFQMVFVKSKGMLLYN